MTHSRTPVPTPVGEVPVGAPGPWTVYGHYLGGDDILIQTGPDVAERFMVDVLGVDLTDECGCELGCGLIWDTRSGEGPDGSFGARPVSVHEQQGLRWDGSCRSEVYLAGQVETALGVGTG